MFKFNFLEPNDETEGEVLTTDSPSITVSQDTSQFSDAELFRELTIDELIKALPPAISYSPLHIPLSESPRVSKTSAPGTRPSGITLARRDLFDTRFQLIAQDDGLDDEVTKQEEIKSQENSVRAVDFVDNPSDLVPGVYEGGFKTWECSFDLVDYLGTSVGPSSGSSSWISGKRILEVGCGTAIPSIYLLSELFNHRQGEKGTESRGSLPETTFFLQDYNHLVLQFVTFPNVLLAWYLSSMAKTSREANVADPEEPEPDPALPGELSVTPELLLAFQDSLAEQKIHLRFFCGSWEAFSREDPLFKDPFDIVLTSETIYQPSSNLSLATLLRRASIRNLDAVNAQTHVSDERVSSLVSQLSLDTREVGEDGRMCLVAAKVLYFGVGGSIVDFEHVVKEHGGQVSIIHQTEKGVGRKIMRIDWE